MRKFDEQTMRALFTLADIEVLQAWSLVNQYDPDLKDPWWLVKTPAGLIKLGWRKRVISIDWSDSAIREVITDPKLLEPGSSTTPMCRVGKSRAGRMLDGVLHDGFPRSSPSPRTA